MTHLLIDRFYCDDKLLPLSIACLRVHSNSMSAVAGRQANDDTSNVPSVLAGLHMYCIAKFNVDLIECVFVIAILLGAFP